MQTSAPLSKSYSHLKEMGDSDILSAQDSNLCKGTTGKAIIVFEHIE